MSVRLWARQLRNWGYLPDSNKREIFSFSTACILVLGSTQPSVQHFSWGWSMKLATGFHQKLKLRMCRVIHLLPHISSWHGALLSSGIALLLPYFDNRK
jgi:hypothetical protein